jgi:excinuclease ABC subunit A
LNGDATAVIWNGKSLPDALALEAAELSTWLQSAAMDDTTPATASLKAVREQCVRRLQFVIDAGLGHLPPGRSVESLASGESRRAALVAVLSTGLVNALYVLDEPASGLHATDRQRVLPLLTKLRDAGNTVVVVEHDPLFLMTADEIIELGPGAGPEGGRIVFQGTPQELSRLDSLSAQVLKTAFCEGAPGTVTAPKSNRRGPPREPTGWLTLRHATHRNLQDIDVRLPLGVVCAVTGVSGSGKSSLVAGSLYPALRAALGLTDADNQPSERCTVSGQEQLENVQLLTHQPAAKSRRSIPATWIGVFDLIRTLFAETHEARTRNCSRVMFSFNASQGGRCPVCEGRGLVTVPMQFLADIEMTCEECSGRRFRPEVIDIRYRNRSIDQVLDMTAGEAFTFFHAQPRIQSRLNALRQAGLDYLRLGQPLTTLSGGEVQRLRLAALLAGVPLAEGEVAAGNRRESGRTRAGRTLFLLDEPSVGLHAADLDRLQDCFTHLLQTGHSIVFVDHNPRLIAAADWRIELGPGAGRYGGRIVFNGRG